MKTNPFTDPTSTIEARMQALERGDFGLIYDSYHPDAPFLAHFTSRSEYLLFAAEQLTGTALSDWGIADQRILSDGQVEVLLWMRVGVDGNTQLLFELALLIREGEQWCYHSAQKLTRADYSGPVGRIAFSHFDQATEKIRF
ncbi:MAG: hypothetical protein C0618_00245 [Desulfuromonas sp.]|nr:MAG: hypothetical protein C0618_00245 [Desulfuromonas sp.]